MAPLKPTTACPTCRRRGCKNPGHRGCKRGPGSEFKTWAQIKRRAAVVENWRLTNGDTCPGYHTPPHQTNDLTADHIIPVAAGGPETGELGVLCRICNSRKRNRTTVR